MTKLRFVKDKEYKIKKYIMKCKPNITIDVMEIRLNMFEVKSNYKGLYRRSLECPMCEKEEDTMEHAFECERLKKIIEIKDVRVDYIKSEEVEKLETVWKYLKEVKNYRYVLGKTKTVE